MRTWDESKHKRDALGRFACQDAVTPEMKKGGLFDGAGSEDERKPFINIQLFGGIDYKSYKTKSLYKSIKRRKKKIEEHIVYINNPHIKYASWESMKAEAKTGAFRWWAKEIIEEQYQIQQTEAEIKRRKENESD